MGEQAVIVDVRTQDEWNQGHLETALHIELDKIETINDNYDFKDHKIYLYCRSGNRSGIALEILKNLGYKDLVNAGGIKEASILLKKEIIK